MSDIGHINEEICHSSDSDLGCLRRDNKYSPTDMADPYVSSVPEWTKTLIDDLTQNGQLPGTG